jgi:hypothetical protein
MKDQVISIRGAMQRGFSEYKQFGANNIEATTKLARQAKASED